MVVNRFLASFLVAASLLLAACSKPAPPPAASDAGSGQATQDSGKSAPGLKDLKSEDVVVGNGETAEEGDTLFVQYTGKLANGTVFDSNDGTDKPPFSFVLGEGQVIQGWDKGMLGMKGGGTRTLSIPAALAYGDSAKPGIPAGSDLYFTVKLLAVVKKDHPGAFKHHVDVKVGTGPEVKVGDTVTINYTIWLLNGKQLYSSQDDGKPETFKVGVNPPQVASGVDYVIRGMRKGGIREVTLPPDLAYGNMASPLIPPKQMLKYRLELVSIK